MSLATLLTYINNRRLTTKRMPNWFVVLNDTPSQGGLEGLRKWCQTAANTRESMGHISCFKIFGGPDRNRPRA